VVTPEDFREGNPLPVPAPSIFSKASDKAPLCLAWDHKGQSKSYEGIDSKQEVCTGPLQRSLSSAHHCVGRGPMLREVFSIPALTEYRLLRTDTLGVCVCVCVCVYACARARLCPICVLGPSVCGDLRVPTWLLCLLYVMQTASQTSPRRTKAFQSQGLLSLSPPSLLSLFLSVPPFPPLFPPLSFCPSASP